jgi:hypothetical protein
MLHWWALIQLLHRVNLSLLPLQIGAAPLIADLSMPAETTTLPWVKIVHYGVFGLLAIGAIAYVLLRPPFLDPMSDPEAAEAMALVQTHRAQQSPTIRQAISERVKELSDKGRGVNLREWRVEREPSGAYLVRVSIREQVTVEWFERNYLWRVDVARRSVIPLTIPASTLMPSEETGASTDVGLRCRLVGSMEFAEWVRCLIRQNHVDDIVLHLNVKAVHRDLMILRPFTAPHVVTPPMPGAFNQVAIQWSFAKRAARMRACVVDGIDCSINIADSYTHAISFDWPAATRRELR